MADIDTDGNKDFTFGIMKTNYWLVLGAMLASSAIAQNNANTLPEMPVPATSPAAAMTAAPTNSRPAPRAARSARPARRTTTRAATNVPAPPRVTATEPASALVPGPAQVTVSNLIVRGQAGLQGEAIAHLFKGDAVTVLSQINLDKHAADEPAQWAKIAYPASASVWVSAKYIDTTNSVVLAKKLNLRAGPGENYSVVGVIERGAPVSKVSTKNDWMKIEAPTNAYAFVAAKYLKQEAPAPVAPAPAPVEPTPPPMPTPVVEAPPIVATPPVVTPPPAPAPVLTAPPAPEPVAIDTHTPALPRIVSHEGVVRHVGSPIAPTEYELYDPRTDVNVNFLYTTSTNLNLSRYVGMRIVVTGQEELARRWNDIPVLTVQKIVVLDTNAVPRAIYRSPRQSQPY